MYAYLGFTFIPSGKKPQGIENVINKAKKCGSCFGDIYISLKEKLPKHT